MAENSKQIFSAEALDKLRSPERLDLMLPVTTSIDWMALAAIGLLLFSVVIWSVFGSFTVKADGMGLIMDSAGVVNISHAASGKVENIFVKTGSKVKKGDLIAQMDQADQTVEARMAQYGVDLGTDDRSVMERLHQYAAKREQQNVARNVYSEYDGIVDAVMVKRGSLVEAGRPICTVRLTENREELTGVLYIPVDKGKRVVPGMDIQLAPNGVDVSKSGSLIGIVRSVSQYPVSAQTVELGLGNPQLAGWIQQAQNSALMEVKFDLVKDENSESGYLWTSVVGEHKPITAGSFCTGSIIIERTPPIERVFYKISQALRSR